MKAVKKGFSFSKHALHQFKERAKNIGFAPASLEVLNKLLEGASPERPKDRVTRWELFKRSVLRGKTVYLVNKGWRFVVDPGRKVVITVERVKPAENYIFLKDSKKEKC